MALIARNTKSGGTTEFATEVALGFDTILDSEVDADFDTAYAEINGNLDDTNIASGANIATSKLAPIATGILVQDAGIVNAHISAAAAIAGSKLAVNGIVSSRPTPDEPGDTSFTQVETTIATLGLTTRGGLVLVTFNAFVQGTAGFGVGAGFTIAIKRDGTPIYTQTTASIGTQPNSNIGFPLALCLTEVPAAGTYTYTVHLTSSAIADFDVHDPRLDLVAFQ